MLSPAEIILQQQLVKILKEAYMTQYEKNKVLEASKYNSNIKTSFEKKANDFANTAADPTAKAIHDFIKEIGITITIPPTIIAPTTIILPGGPCTGIIPMSNIQIS